MKLALGTVQFGLSYGIANTSGQTSSEEAARIIARARECGLDTLDTAAAYGESERVLGDIGVTGWKIVTKVPPIKVDEHGRRWVLDHVRRSLAALRVERLDAILLHNASDLYGVHGSEMAVGLQEARAEGLVEKIGYSIYAPDSLNRLLEVMPPDQIQAPFNVVDQRLAKTGWLRRLDDAGIEVHVRSVFLQGLLLMPRDRRPTGFDRWRSLWERWDTLVKEHDGSALAACLGFVRQQHGISRVVVGVDNALHLDQLVHSWRNAVAVDGATLSCDDPQLVEPSNWNSNDHKTGCDRSLRR